jgi:hypothetical protein
MSKTNLTLQSVVVSLGKYRELATTTELYVIVSQHPEESNGTRTRFQSIKKKWTEFLFSVHLIPL